MDHYQTLGVAKNASPDDIKKAYRKLASIHHPDKGGDTAMFQNVQTAYDILSDPQKRSSYDNPQPQGFPGGFHFTNQGFDMNDLFSQMFAQQRQQSPTYKTDVWVTLEQVVSGDEQILQFNTHQGSRVVKIDIPKGIENGQQIRYADLIPNAILIVEFKHKPHHKFEKRGIHLWASTKVSVLDLIVGTTFEFTTITGKVFEVKINPKTQPGSVLRIPNQGLHQNGIVGDQMILLEAFIPVTIDNAIIDSIMASKLQKVNNEPQP